MIENRSRDQMYGHGEYPGMYESVGNIENINIPKPANFVPPDIASFDFKRRVEKEERDDATLKTLREEAGVTGDLSAVMAYKRSKMK